MFKSKSTTRLDNNTSDYQCASTFTSPFADMKSTNHYSSKKYGVKFEMENNKQNSPVKQRNLGDQLKFQRREKSTKTWTQRMVPTEEDQCDDKWKKYKQNKELLNQNQKHVSYNIRSPLKYSKPKMENPSYLSKHQNTQNSNYLSSGFSKMSKQCRSMKTLPSYDPEEDSYDVNKQKKMRKNQKLQAYNSLLKSSEELIQRYKKLQDQKTQLKHDLKSQKDFNHSKSSKKIMFSDQISTSYDKGGDFASNTYSGSKRPYTSKPYESTFQNKYDTYNITISSKYDKYEGYDLSKSNHLSKSHVRNDGHNLNKTFSSRNLIEASKSPSKSKYQTSTYTKQTLTSSMQSGKANKISVNDFQLGKLLGSGAFGEVFPATHKKTRMLFALKKVKKQSVKHMLDQFIQQIKIQLFLDHPNIVKLYSFWDDALHFYILMEYMEGGSLYGYLKKNKALNVEQASQKLKQVCYGLKHMHDNQVLHRDIKPQNIVLTHNVSKLCDFGWSAICKDRRTTYCGTLDYVCPEIIDGNGYDDSVDIWCIGVLAYELIAGKTPFYNISRKQTMKKIMDVKLEYPQNMPQVAVRFIKNILRKNPQERTDIDQVLKDPLLNIQTKKQHFL